MFLLIVDYFLYFNLTCTKKHDYEVTSLMLVDIQIYDS